MRHILLQFLMLFHLPSLKGGPTECSISTPLTAQWCHVGLGRFSGSQRGGRQIAHVVFTTTRNLQFSLVSAYVKLI